LIQHTQAISTAQAMNSAAGNSGMPNSVASRSQTLSNGKLNIDQPAANSASRRWAASPWKIMFSSSQRLELEVLAQESAEAAHRSQRIFQLLALRGFKRSGPQQIVRQPALLALAQLMVELERHQGM
jgi:hypothetical protein